MVRSELALVEEMTGEQMAELELRDVKVESNRGFVTFTSRVRWWIGSIAAYVW